jgi:hypothetical protein
VSAANVQAGQAEVITDLINALVSLMLALKRSLLNRVSILINVLKALASNISICSLHLIEDYTEIFYMIDRGDIPPFQCKMSLRGPKSMRKVDGLSLIFIDLYVSTLTPEPGPRRSVNLLVAFASTVVPGFIS